MARVFIMFVRFSLCMDLVTLRFYVYNLTLLLRNNKQDSFFFLNFYLFCYSGNCE